ncbi:hypothetical protein ACFXTO_009615 [Malus domestica]
MIESVINTCRQGSTYRYCFGHISALTEHSTRATRSLEHPCKISPHSAHSCTVSFLAPGRIRVDLDGPVFRSLPVRDIPDSS